MKRKNTEKEIRRRIEEFVGESADTFQQRGPRFMERHDGPTPNGGAYSIAYFYDKNRTPCEKEKAKYINIVEYSKDGRRLNEVYGVHSKQ